DKQPGHQDALVLLADTAQTPKEIEETRGLIAALLEHDQERPGYHLAVGELDLRQPDLAHAEREFQAALKLDPTSNKAFAALGKLYWMRSEPAAAERAFKAAAELSPLRSPIRLQYADFKFRSGRVAEAKSILQDISDKLPDYLRPRVALMRI